MYMSIEEWTRTILTLFRKTKKINQIRAKLIYGWMRVFIFFHLGVMYLVGLFHVTERPGNVCLFWHE